jgi:hypothetical protein
MPSAGAFGRFLRQSAPERMPADLKLLGDLDLGVIAGTQQRPRLFQTAFLQRLGSAADSSPRASGLETGVDPLAQYVALKFRGGKDMKGQLAARRVVLMSSVREGNSTPRSLSRTVVSISRRRDSARRSSFLARRQRKRDARG